MIGNWLDAVLLAWLALGALRGFAAGLYRAGARLVGLVASLVLAARYAHAGAGWLAAHTGAEQVIRRLVVNGGFIPPEAARLPAREGLQALSGLMGQLPVPPGLSLPSASPGEMLGEYLVAVLSSLVLDLVAFLGIVAVVNGIANLAGWLLQGTLGRLPLLGGLGRIGGAVLGLAQTTLSAAVAAGLLAPVLRLLSPAAAVVLAHSALVPPLVRVYRLFLSVGGL